MKKVYLMKGMAAMAFGLVVTSCNKMDLFNANAEQEAKEKEFTENFQSVVMGGQTIDPNQTWSTTTPVQVSVTPRTSGTLKIYATSPIGNAAAALYTVDVTAGNKTTFTVTKPADAAKLYAAVYDADGMIDDMLSFEANGAAEVIFNKTASNRAARRVAPEMPTQPDTPTNTIDKPSEPTDIPSATNYTELIDEDKTVGGFSDNSKIYVAPGVTLTIDGEWAGIGKGSKIYLGAKSKLVKTSGNLYAEMGEIYNDGGIINATLSLNGTKVWNKGTITAGDVYGSANNASTIYNEGTITVDNIYFNKYDLLWNEGTFTSNGELNGGNDETKIYNKQGATIYANSFSLNNDKQLCWNEGTIEVTNAAATYNSGAAIVNIGTFKAGSFSQAAGGQFFNVNNSSVVLISGTTSLGNSNSVWVNNGDYTTDYFEVNQGGNQTFNLCRLTVKEKFSMGCSDGSFFVLQGDAAVVCEKDFDWNGDAYFWMGADSWLKVDGTLKSNNINNDGKGFIQYGDNMAVISADAITTDNPDGQARFCVFGNVCIDANSIFDLTDNNHIFSGNVKQSGQMYTANVPEAWKTATDCRPAYEPQDPNPEVTQWYYYAFEDLGTTDDFDFNDVILRVSAPVNNKSTVELVAAGGTLPTYLFYNGTLLSETEVHSLIGAASVTDMVNTGRGSKKPFVKVTDIDVTSDTKLDQLLLGIGITSENGQTTRVTRSVENNGDAPLVIVVNGDDNGKWFWPTERTTISDAYSGFGAWGANVSTNTNWYKNATGSVYEW